MGTPETTTDAVTEPRSKARPLLVGAAVVLAGFALGLAIQKLRLPCPCNERLGEPEASAEAVALAGAAMATYPPLPDFDTPRIRTTPPTTQAPDVPGVGVPSAGAPFASNGNGGPEYPPPLPTFDTERIPVVAPEGAPARAPRKRAAR